MGSICDKIEAIEYAEDRGNYSNVAKMMDFYGEAIRSSGDEEAKDRYLSLVERITYALEYEALHGAGSLLKLDDPINQQLISSGIILPNKVEAALRHCERASTLKSEACSLEATALAQQLRTQHIARL